MALGTHLHEKARGAVVGTEGSASDGATQKKDATPPCPVQFTPILKAPGVNPAFVQMSDLDLRHLWAGEDEIFEIAQTDMDNLME